MRRHNTSFLGHIAISYENNFHLDLIRTQIYMFTNIKHSLLNISVNSCVLNGLRWILLANLLVAGSVLALMTGMWFEFSSPLVLHLEPALGLEAAAVSLRSETNELLMAFSSRDSASLMAMMIIWNALAFLIVSLATIAGLRRLGWRLMLALAAVFVGMLALNVMALPSVIDNTYLYLISALFVISVASFYSVKHYQRRLALQPKNAALIAYASQSGTAKSIALNMASAAVKHCDCRSFADLTPENLQDYEQLLVVAATYGEGQAPEKTIDFLPSLANFQQSLSHLKFSVLALGDKAYPQFCAYGQQVAQALSKKGAKVMHPIQEVDRAQPQVIAQWWQDICQLSGWRVEQLDKQWIQGEITNNLCLNSQQSQRPAHTITINVDNVKYQAGDLLEIMTPTPITTIDERLLEYGLEPQTMVRLNGQACELNHALTQLEWTNQVANSPQALVNKLAVLRPRVYSIASAPDDNQVRLLVRHLKKDDGSDGFSSAHLCNANIGQIVNVAVRQHDSFRLPPSNVPVIMIGAGTGIAPFMSFLAQRRTENGADNWLIFGEQYSSHDNYFNNELDDHIDNGTLTRIDYAFSRDSQWQSFGKPSYVNEVIQQQSKLLFHWLYDKDAQLYVCGNKAGMGESVKDALKQLLQEDFQRLEQANRLHFDLY